jgi:AraC-like DNA-binding protein|tara:strand:+ start:1181 stop:2053 length:873 start_codon:yes stop_codon:yes gene_type:complete
MIIKANLEAIQLENRSFSYQLFDVKNNNLNNKLKSWHYHPEIELVYVNNGKGKRQVGLHLSNFQDGDLVMIGSNVPHTGFTEHFDKDRKEVVIQFKSNFLGDSIDKVLEFKNINKLFELSKRGLVFSGETKKKIGITMLGLQYETPIQKILTLIKMLNDLSISKDVTILNAENFDSENIQENERIKKVFNYIRRSYKEEVSLNEVSELVFMTPPSFCRYFKSKTNKTFTTFLNEYRINNALKLLAQSELDIKNICFQCGYNNFSHFNRLFKKQIQMTPSEYRRKMNSQES